MIVRLIKYSIIILILLVCACEQQSKPSVPPLAEKGVLDLTHWDFERDGPVELSGEYEFYWNRLIDPQDFIQSRHPLKPAFIDVPGPWNDFEYQGKALPGDGFASYRLTVLLNKTNTELALDMLEQSSSYLLFVNGQRLSSAGVVGQTAESAKPGYRPESIVLQSNEGSLDLIVQISNFSHKNGGAWETFTLGTRGQLEKNQKIEIAYNLSLFGSILIMALYHLGLFSLRKKELSTLYFGLFCLLIALRVLTTGERHILLFFPAIDYEIMIKLEYLTFYLAVPVFVQYFRSLFSNRFSKVICMLSTAIGLVFGALVLLSPVRIFSATLGIFQVFTIAMFMYATAILVISSLNKESKAIIFLAGFLALFLTSVNDMLYAQNIIQSIYMVQLGLFIFIFSQAFLISRNFSKAFVTIAIQQEKLKKSKATLEKRVRERTAKILKVNQALRHEIADRKQAQQATKKAQRVAEFANRAKSEFLANMSHELRTPLNHILGFTELILDQNFGQLNETQEEYLKDVYSSSEHLLSLINDILDLSKVEAGKLELKPSPVRIRDVLENSLVMIKEKALKGGIELTCDLDGIPDSIKADERKLKQILYNLLSNAVKFTPMDGCILLAARLTDNVDRPNRELSNSATSYLLISVEDSGIGLKKNDLERIFEPFEQVESSASRHYQGTGLGLSLARRLVDLHGGKIWAESQGEGKGATFSFRIPV